MADHFAIRPFQPRFAGALVALWRASFAHGVGVAEPDTFEQHCRYFDEHVRPETTVQLIVDEEIDGDAAGAELVGFIATTPETVVQLYVHVDHLGRGIGTRLLALAKAQSGGSLWLYTFARNARARQLRTPRIRDRRARLRASAPARRPQVPMVESACAAPHGSSRPSPAVTPRTRLFAARHIDESAGAPRSGREPAAECPGRGTTVGATRWPKPSRSHHTPRGSLGFHTRNPRP